MKEKKARSRIVIYAMAAVMVAVLALSSSMQLFTPESGIKKFSSYAELEEFVKAGGESYAYRSDSMLGAVSDIATDSKPAAQESVDYSTTNIQVEGVDEADIVKTDGRYIYTISGTKVVITEAYPVENARKVSELEFNTTGYPQEIFVNGDSLVVFGNTNSMYAGIESELSIMPRYYSQKAFVKIYDISSKESPELDREILVNGYYVDSRMIGDYVYVITSESIYYDSGLIPMPMIEYDGVSKRTSATDIYYFGYPDSSYTFTNVISINLSEESEPEMKTFLLGYSEYLYVSESNIYISYTKRISNVELYERIINDAIIPSVPSNVASEIAEIQRSDMDEYQKMTEIGKVLYGYLDSLGPEEGASVMKTIEERSEAVYTELSKELEKTVVHKIGIDGGKIEYLTSGEVPGYVLDQFSMDENNGYLRIATTTGNSWRSGATYNHLYVLDSDMEIVGKLEDLAEGESVHSARFMGDRAYIVTFKQVDPLFVIDLSNPQAPSVLGYLKVTGVSEYLHPYDSERLIGIGRDANEGGVVTGMKISIFDVSDVSNPIETAKYTISDSDSWTYSESLYDHKSVLFSKSKGLLVIPIQTSKSSVVDGEYKWDYWQGAYAFEISPSSISLKGKVTHMNETAESEYYSQPQVRRSLYIEDTLYTISPSMIKMNSLETMEDVGSIELPYQSYYYPYR